MTKLLIIVGGAVGALVGAVLSTTEKGKEMDKNLNDALDIFDNRISKYLPGGLDNVKDLLEE